MTKYFSILALFLTEFALMSPSVDAAIYKGIKPGLSLNDVMAMFPGCYSQEEVVSGWRGGDKRVIQLSGGGISGAINLFMSKLSLRDLNVEQRKFYESLPESRSLTVNFTQWVPESPVTIRQLVSVFGKNFKKQINRDEFFTVLIWPNGANARLDQSGKYGQVIEYHPTAKEAYDGGYFRYARFYRDYRAHQNSNSHGTAEPPIETPVDELATPLPDQGSSTSVN